MKTITFNVCSFNELSEEAKNKAIEDNFNTIADILCENDNSEYAAAIESLERATNTKVKDYEVDICRGNPIFKIHVNTGWNENDADDITGKHLYRKVYREIIHNFQEKKTYYKNNKKRQSRITIEKGNTWSITGTWTEDSFESIIKNYYTNWNKYPDNYSLQDLMNECWSAFFHQWQNDLEYHYDHKEEIIDYMQTNEYEFKEDGSTYWG